MSLLNRPSDGLASVLIALHRSLSVYGTQTEEDLISIVAPPSILGKAKPAMVKNTLNRWKRLGFFETDAEGKLKLAADVPPYPTPKDDDLRAAILEIILRDRNNTTLLPTDADDDEKEGGFSDASDLTRAASWMLAQDPFTFPDTLEDATRLQSDQRIRSTFVNDTRWSGFREWAVFLGLANTPAGRLVPNPAIAIRASLFRTLGDRGESQITSVLNQLASFLPILDGGRYRIEVQSQIESPWREQMSHEISTSLSVALLTLEAGKELRMDSRSDAPQRMLLGPKGQPLREVSHIVDVRTKA